MRRLLTWFLRLIRKNKLKESQACLGVQVRVTASFTCKGQVGTIIDNENTQVVTVQLEDMSPMHFMLDELELYDDSRTTMRPIPGIAIEQLLDFALFCSTKLIEYPKFLLVSPLTLRHLTRESMRAGLTWYTQPTFIDLGNCPVMSELTVQGIPVIDKLPAHMVARDGFEIPHFVAGIGLDSGVYYLTALLNPEMVHVPQNYRGMLSARKTSNTQLNTEFNNLAKDRKSKARWNF